MKNVEKDLQRVWWCPEKAPLFEHYIIFSATQAQRMNTLELSSIRPFLCIPVHYYDASCAAPPQQPRPANMRGRQGSRALSAVSVDCGGDARHQHRWVCFVPLPLLKKHSWRLITLEMQARPGVSSRASLAPVPEGPGPSVVTCLHKHAIHLECLC